jgi:hypothetical protein
MTIFFDCSIRQQSLISFFRKINFVKAALPDFFYLCNAFEKGKDVLYLIAQMAELVDALVSGTSIRWDVQVRVLFWAQNNKKHKSKYL